MVFVGLVKMCFHKNSPFLEYFYVFNYMGLLRHIQYINNSLFCIFTSNAIDGGDKFLYTDTG